MYYRLLSVNKCDYFLPAQGLAENFLTAQGHVRDIPKGKSKRIKPFTLNDLQQGTPATSYPTQPLTTLLWSSTNVSPARLLQPLQDPVTMWAYCWKHALVALQRQ